VAKASRDDEAGPFYLVSFYTVRARYSDIDPRRNIMSSGPLIFQRPTSHKSNTELLNSLRTNLQVSKDEAIPVRNGQIDDIDRRMHGYDGNALPYWTHRDGETLYIPSPDFESAGLAEERSKYDITVKLFFLPTTNFSARDAHTREAVGLVLRELHASSIDLLIVSFPGISFDADDDEDTNLEGDEQEAEKLDDVIRTWHALEELHDHGIVAQLGLAEFGIERLKRFLPEVRIRPSVDQINVRDVCLVPKPLILYAKQEEIKLLMHHDCTNILPKGTIRELLGTSDGGVGVLTDDGGEGLKGDVEPQWVVKYTAVVRDRGVIESKGYFAMAYIGD
jgi:glutamate--cysteine ligase regulatory subunit